MGTTTTTNIGYTKPDQAEKNTIVFQNNNWDLADLLAGQTVGKNVLINSNFLLNQEDVSGSVVLSAGENGHDGWKAGSGGCSYTFATSQNITTITISAGTLVQETFGEDLTTGTYIFHWQGTATGRINVDSFTVSPQTGSLTGGTNSIVEIGAGTLILPKLEIGTIETINLIDSFKDVIRECEYRFRKSYPLEVAAGTSNFNGLLALIAHDTSRMQGFQFEKMRDIPTIVIFGSDGTLINIEEIDGSSGITVTTITADLIGENGATRITVSGGDPLVTGSVYRLHYTADARP